MLLQEKEAFSVNIPELRLLKQYQIDVSLWVSRFNDIMTNVHLREDQKNVIDELNRILEDGQALKIQGSCNSYIQKFFGRSWSNFSYFFILFSSSG